MVRLRIYIDTSVVGGCLDEEFSKESRALFEMARSGELVFLISDLLLEELSRAPQYVQELLPSLPISCTEQIAQSEESRRLCLAYLAAKVVSLQSESDAHHVAMATLAQADAIVSWNFRHIVHFDKIRLFNAVNRHEGYPSIDIRSPKEFV
jgi:predicted nucleic acid-binding protein